ncbi:nitrogen fixation protein NifQ [Methylocapsa sp. D3K7]|uniref:nitrogen fixation protein NifQ n=1 Tax=Methylocapsa sp. D3K7 TaxID=3041435 RepID=UPI00244EF642|nr:nitrogen fixation protein NifQ [Methylocapsa sp. D3K7]WGJ13174.1 nitrogen fixation protein NifQ [Methylocapsa sp. D3K7]
MRAEEAYQWLIGASVRTDHDAFDIHVVASVIALAIEESDEDRIAVAGGVGLAGPVLMELTSAMFPGTEAFFELAGVDLVIDDEEQSLRDILGMYSSGVSSLERPLAAMIARRCKCPHHLWQDLGLRDRGELSRLMKRHFARLAEKNQHDMKWKKFLYRMVCGSEGFTLCTSPVCSECDDFVNCFGAEDGAALLVGADAASEKAA